MSNAAARLAMTLCLFLGTLAPSVAAETRGTANEAAVGVLADTRESFELLLRIERGLDHVDGLRVLPIAGKGPVQTLADLVYLRGVDAALLTSDTLAFAEANGLLKGVASKVSFVVRLAGLDVHVIARDGIASFGDLADKTIATGSTTSSSYVAAQLLLSAAGLSANTIVADGADAIAAVASGKADAAILVGRRPLAGLGAAKGLHLIDVAVPESLQASYSPSLLSHEDYPQLIPQGHSVETLSASLVVAVFNWQRGAPQYVRTRRFVDALFAALQPGGNNDANLNLAASVPGWNRHGAAEDALKSRAAKVQAASPAATEN
jgi:uncharacterized protein